MSLKQMILSKEPIKEIGSFLDSLSHEQRLTEMYAVKGKLQGELYDMADGQANHLIGDFIPEGIGPGTQVIHWGHNSLPLHTKFQKRFALSAKQTDPQVCIGYNEQSLRFFSGPGYYTAKDHKWEDRVDRVVVDYFDVPDEKLPEWPPILPNSARLSRVIYFQTRDWMWKVSQHVTIGRAKKLDDWMDNWFFLCREDPK